MSASRTAAPTRRRRFAPARQAWGALLALGLAGLSLGAASAEEPVISAHGYSFFGELSYPPDFEHLDYVNPDAPKGGEISIAVTGTFDTMNPYYRQGEAAALSSSMYESLLADMPMSGGAFPADVDGEYYGLLAHTIEYPESKDWVIFHMRPEARFSDGTPVTAHDVHFSHKLLLEQGLESYARAVKARVPEAEVIDDHTIKFTFADGYSRRSLIETVGFTSVWSRDWYEETGAKLNESRFDVSPGSGPYVIEEVERNRRVVYARNPDYWGWDLPINKGRHNFDRIRLEYFTDPTAAFEAFKAGEVTLRTESEPQNWVTGYDFPALNRGDVMREELPDGNPPAMTGIVFNLGSEILQDIRVREAISYAFNFEWTNQSLLNGLYAQQRSFAHGTPEEAKGPLTEAELAFLADLGDVVPDDFLTAAPRVPHESDPDDLLSRRMMGKALRTLSEAGWTIDSSGDLRNAEGAPLTITFLLNSTDDPTDKALVTNFVNNLDTLGFDIRLDAVDNAQFGQRREQRDYDLILRGYPAVTTTGAGLMQRFGSEDAAYSLFNPAGLASPLVDAIIEKSLDTETQEEEDLAVSLIDRALRYEFFVIPTGFVPDHWVAYWNMYERPETQPPFALGVLDFWWYDAQKAEALRASGALR